MESIQTLSVTSHSQEIPYTQAPSSVPLDGSCHNLNEPIETSPYLSNNYGPLSFYKHEKNPYPYCHEYWTINPSPPHNLSMSPHPPPFNPTSSIQFNPPSNHNQINYFVTLPEDDYPSSPGGTDPPSSSSMSTIHTPVKRALILDFQNLVVWKRKPLCITGHPQKIEKLSENGKQTMLDNFIDRDNTVLTAIPSKGDTCLDIISYGSNTQVNGKPRRRWKRVARKSPSAMASKKVPN